MVQTRDFSFVFLRHLPKLSRYVLITGDAGISRAHLCEFKRFPIVRMFVCLFYAKASSHALLS
jgi:hypothetical protein